MWWLLEIAKGFSNDKFPVSLRLESEQEGSIQGTMDNFDWEAYEEEYESGFESEDEEVAPEVYCVESNYVACYLPNTDYKFKVHHRCWGQWGFRDQVVVTAYRSQKHHLINNTPSHNCAYCQQDVYYIDLASNCDICALLQNV